MNFTVKGNTITPDGVTGNSEFFAPNLKIYPNPFEDAVRITGAVSVGAGLAPAQQTGRGQAQPLRITNAAGMVVHTQTITGDDETTCAACLALNAKHKCTVPNTRAQSASIRLGHLPAGVYFFTFEKEKR